MNVEMLNNHNSNKTSDIDKTTYGNLSFHDSRMKAEKLGYSLDITGKVTENAAYGKEDLKSAQEMMQAVGMQDVTVQRNYMAVMSNSMSEEDFGELLEEGGNPLDTDLSECVTNLDKIKIKMAESGQVIEGYNDDITDDDIKAALGSNLSASQLIRSALSNADLPDSRENVESIKEMMSVSENLTALNDSSLAYMVKEDLEPTIENLYKAEYSATDGRSVNHGVRFGGVATYMVGTLDENNWNSIKSQAMEIVETSNCTDEKAGLEEAKWLVAHDIPLTFDTLNRYEELKGVILPARPTELLNRGLLAIQEGKTPMQANILDTESLYKKAVTLSENFMNLPEEGDITRRRLLEEVRLSMSYEANLTLLRKGISIDTSDLSKLVEELKEAEREFYRPVLGYENKANDVKSDINGKVLSNDELDERISLFKETRRVIDSIVSVPVKVIADTYTSDKFSLGAVEKVGSGLRLAYEKAGETYEALMTSPRADMGDSIKKAFRNVDEILKDLGFELNDTNRKAVRTLGYAGMMINRESVENIRKATMSVERVIGMMTPQKTLSMIRSGHNPLSENIFELEESLSEESISEKSEKYSRFLWRLERSGEITSDEKDAFIGMYRLFDKIEKMDGKVIGNVLSNGEELTFENMLKAVRSNRAKNMDITVDDDFGLLEELVKDGESISDQIEKGFMQILTAKPSKDYIEEKLRSLRTAAKYPEEARELLTAIEQPVTVENILAVGSMSSEMGKSYKKLFGNDSSDKDEEKLDKEDADELIENFDDSIKAEENYEKFMLKAQKISQDRIFRSENYSDVQNYAMMYKQIGFAATLSKGQSYELPIYTKEGWTSVHVTFKSSDGKTPGVTVSFSTQEYGNVKGSFAVKENGVDGLIVSDSREAVDNLRLKDEEICREIEKSGLGIRGLSYVYSSRSTENGYYGLENGEKVTGEKLYKIAKSFIKAMSELQ